MKGLGRFYVVFIFRVCLRERDLELRMRMRLVCVRVCFSDILFWREKGPVWCLLGFDSKGRRLKNKGEKHGGFDANRVSKWKRTDFL